MLIVADVIVLVAVSVLLYASRTCSYAVVGIGRSWLELDSASVLISPTYLGQLVGQVTLLRPPYFPYMSSVPITQCDRDNTLELGLRSSG